MLEHNKPKLIEEWENHGYHDLAIIHFRTHSPIEKKRLDTNTISHNLNKTSDEICKSNIFMIRASTQAQILFKLRHGSALAYPFSVLS